MKLEDFDYDLPAEQIASHPLPNRRDSRLLVLDKNKGSTSDEDFKDFLSYVTPNDLLVFNDTRVMHARLKANKASGGAVSMLVERLLTPHQALLHIKSNKKLKLPCELKCEDGSRLVVTSQNDGLYKGELQDGKAFTTLMDAIGDVPLPPYIKREAESHDNERYQTVYAKSLGAVAAPTAGLHFDQAMMATIKDQKIPYGFVTLHVGAGTFQPVRVASLDEHIMHYEYAAIDEIVCQQIKACKARGGRVIAIGTTVVRTLESWAQKGEGKAMGELTNLFIKPPYTFQCVDAIFTDFHLPKSTLLMLICAFGGYEQVRKGYEHAIQAGYRFFSYGDAMFLL